MTRYYDIIGYTLCVIFIDHLSGVSIFKRKFDDLTSLFKEFDCLHQDDLIECFEMLKKSPEWISVIFENYVVSSPSGAFIF